MALYVVAGPIGNLEDISFRAVRTLREVEAIIAEDTRTFRKLAQTYNLPNKTVYSLYKGNESGRVAQLVPKLQAGLEAALVSEAGTPAVSDPGAMLVRACLENGVRVIPIPGPSSFTAVLSAAGVYAWPVVFFGFLPKKKSVDDVSRTVMEGRTAVFFESPRRFPETLKALSSSLPDARLVVGRELTKHFEEIWSGKAADAAAAFAGRTLKGELVLVVEPTAAGSKSEISEDRMGRARAELGRLRDAKITLSSAVRKISSEHDLPRGRIYQEALKIW